jgi:UDP-N-acetyl-D-glucosamine dehydrogenase
MRVVVVGQGYVGLPLATAAAEAGHTVVGIDVDKKRIDLLNSGVSPVADISDAILQKIITSNNYSASDSFVSVSDADVVCICVPTPLNSQGAPDLSAFESALEAVGANLGASTLVIIESTISPGTTRGLAVSILSTVSRHKDFEVVYSPERIDPANKKWNVKNTPKLVAGLTPEGTLRATHFYSSFVETITAGSSVEVIETAKLLENSFRFVNISFINEVAVFCEKLGIDVREVVDAAATKPYGFMPFYPGAGVGGHCIPVDPAYLAEKAREIGAPTRFIDLANEVNLSMPSFFAGKAEGMLGTLSGKKVLVVGVAYKPDVSDVRETPASGLIKALRAAGAVVSWHDHLVLEWNGETSVPLASDYDLVVLVNPHSSVDLTVLDGVPVLNTRGGM